MRILYLALAGLLLSQPANRADAAAQRSAEASPQYRLSGATPLRPSRIWDDGEHTYISWPADAELPAVFSVGPDGREILAEGAMREDNYVLDRVHSTLIFRIDRAVAKASRRGGRHE